ncbi:hypothetical protein [uncultured Massilia sp.]|uniref:hypothetical protein n=1 Tax=uncultured Massilia sp. TaxID=169973 RepID=UPI0035A26C03
MVYWTVVTDDGDGDGPAGPRARPFATDAMVDAMRFMEDLRRRQREGGAIRFVTMCSEHPDAVGHPGVDVTGPDYDWKKRRR